MPDLYGQNVAFFEKHYPGIYNQIKDRVPEDKYQIIECKHPGCQSILCSNDTVLPLHSRYNPAQEADLWASNQDLTGRRHVLLFGFGLGYHLEALVRIHPDINFHIYEPDINIFLNTMKYKDWSQFVWSNIKNVCLENGDSLAGPFINEMVKLVKEDWIFVSIPSYERCFTDLFASFKESLKQVKHGYLEHLLANMVFEKDWTINAVRNLPCQLKYNSIFSYKDYFKGKTVVMTASGPSLDKAMPYLKMVKEKKKAILISVGTSVNGLLKAGLVPDMFVSYDPAIENYLVHRDNLEKGVQLLFGSTINHEVVKNHKGPKSYFILNQDTIFNYLVGVLDNSEIISDAPTISIVAIQLLDRLGVDKVILAGQDLSYHDDIIYADSTSILVPDSKVTEDQKAQSILVESNKGGTVYTTNSFNKMRAGIEYFISASKFSSIINTAEYGAKIAGTTYMDWDQLIDILPDNAVSEPPVFTEEGGILLRQTKRRINRIVGDFEGDFIRIDREVNKFLESSDDFSPERMGKIFDNISRYLGKMTSTKEFILFIQPMIRNEDHILRKFIPDLQKMTLEQKRQFIANEFNKYLRGVRLAILQLQDAVKDWDRQVESETVQLSE